MRYRLNLGLLRAPMFAVAVGLSIATPTAAVEIPHDRAASAYLGAAVQGPGYKVDPAVPSDGFMRQFTIETDQGRIRVDGVALARQRVRELQALDRLQKMSESDVFTKSLGKALR